MFYRAIICGATVIGVATIAVAIVGSKALNTGKNFSSKNNAMIALIERGDFLDLHIQ